MQRALLTYGAATFHGLPLLLGEHRRVGVIGKSGLQVLTAKREGLGAIAVSEETEVPDFDEARGQDMEKVSARI